MFRDNIEYKGKEYPVVDLERRMVDRWGNVMIGTAKRQPKYTESVMRNVRQALGIEPDDISLDAEIEEMDKTEVFRKWLQWEGIYGYTEKIKNAVDSIFYGR